jgi:hypothetical protein
VLYGYTGRVTDSTGAVLASARVETVNVNTGVVSQATTDTSGGYRFVALLPGVYRVSISAPGFKTMTTDGVRVAANAVARVDTQMEIAKTSETVMVTAESQLLQTDRSDVHSDLNATQTQSFPAISSEGKTFQALYRIIPGASLPGENNSAAGNPQRAMTTNVNGQSNQGSNTRIDGVQDAYPWLHRRTSPTSRRSMLLKPST